MASSKAAEIKTGGEMENGKAATPVVKKIDIVTGLTGKDEVFRMLAIARATKLPLLLVGEAGVSKTACVLDFAHASYPTREETIKNVYILETDEGTRTSEIKGTLNVKDLVVHNNYSLHVPVALAPVVVINEVDKASSGLRNAMLGVMNEGIVFNGEQKIPCAWKNAEDGLFVATCNVIPKEEVGNPFWDRFMLKFTVSRVSANEMIKYFKNGGKKFSQTLKINVPTPDEVADYAATIPVEKLETFVSLVRTKCSDRTLSFVPTIAAAVALVYKVGVDKALVKTAWLLTNDNTLAKELDKKLSPAEKRAVMDKIDLLPGIRDEKQLEQAIDALEKMVEQYQKGGKLTAEDISEIETAVNTAMENHPIAEYDGVDIDTKDMDI